MKKHDVCVTSTSPVLSSEDFAAFFAVWIVRVCSELGLSAASGRPQLGAAELKQGSREWNALRTAIVASRVVVCIVNVYPEGKWPPPGHEAELAWAAAEGIPVVPFYDADRYKWKEVCNWRTELPSAFRSGLGPIRYRRASHAQAKDQLNDTLRLALADEAAQREAQLLADEGREASEAGEAATARKALELELSRKERRLLGNAAPSKRTPRGEKMGRVAAAALALEDGEWGDGLGLERLGRADFERAGLVERRLERTPSLRDINVEAALQMLSKRAAAAVRPRGVDLLAPRDGGVRLRFLDGKGPADLQVEGRSEPAHHLLAPTRGILKKKGKKSEGEKLSLAASADRASSAKQLRLGASDGGDDPRFRFALQQLQKHLDELKAEDVHELTTVIRSLKDGVQEAVLVVRALPLLRTFLEVHMSLHARALKQDVVVAIVAAMNAHDDSVDVLVNGCGAIAALLAGSVVDARTVDASGEVDCVSLVTKQGGLEAVVAGMRRFAACEALQDRGCRCLALLARGSVANKVSADYRRGGKVESNVILRGQARQLIARHGGVPLLLDGMRRYPANAELQAAGCLALGQLGASEVRVKKRAAEGGVIGLVMRALGQHAEDAGVQQAACGAFRQLASRSQQNKDSIGDLGGVKKICEAAHRFLGTSHRRVPVEAFGALCHLASKHAENKQRIFDCQALELVIEALKVEAEVEVELAYAGCGLLHNLSCDDAIKRHVVKLGGRELAERLEKHSSSAVRGVAHVLARTLAPPETSGGDPFCSMFATRTLGTTNSKRVTSRRGRKKAAAALQGLNDEVEGLDMDAPQPVEECHRQKKTPKVRRMSDDDDAKSEGGASDASAASNFSDGSTYSGSRRHRPGEKKQSTRRFNSAWDEEKSLGEDSTKAPDEDNRSEVSTVVSEASSDASALSLEANECLAKGDLAGALGHEFRVRSWHGAEAPDRRKRLKERRAQGAPAGRGAPDAGVRVAPFATPSEVSVAPSAWSASASAVPRETRETRESGISGRLSRTMSNLEKEATKRLDEVGLSLRRI